MQKSQHCRCEKHCSLDAKNTALAVTEITALLVTVYSDFIADSRIDAWIFGHSHVNEEATIGNTRLACNQLGYVAYGEHLGGFDGGKFIEI